MAEIPYDEEESTEPTWDESTGVPEVDNPPVEIAGSYEPSSQSNEDWLTSLEGQTVGNDSNRDSDLANMASKAPGDLAAYKDALTTQYRNRMTNTPGGDSGGGDEPAVSMRTPGGPAGPGVYAGTGAPVQQVGQDPFSQAITGGYSKLIGREGATDTTENMLSRLMGIIESGGATSTDPKLLAQRMEAKRQPIEAFRRMQTNQMRGELANRGLMSEPGQPQGSEIGALGRFDERLAPYYATAGQELASEQGRADDARFNQALGLASNLGQAQTQNMLSALGGGSQRQGMLSQIALDSLGQNMEWNKFLAMFGLERDKVMEELQQGQMSQIAPLLQLFQQFASTSAGGAE